MPPRRASASWSMTLGRAREYEQDRWLASVVTAEARVCQLEAALTKIAEHDGTRHDWIDDVAVDKPTPQEIAQDVLASAPTGKEP